MAAEFVIGFDCSIVDSYRTIISHISAFIKTLLNTSGFVAYVGRLTASHFDQNHHRYSMQFVSLKVPFALGLITGFDLRLLATVVLGAFVRQSSCI